MALVADYGMSSDESEEETPGMTGSNGRASTSHSRPETSNIEQSDEVLEDFVKKTNYGDQPLEKPPPKPSKSDSLAKLRLPATKGKIQISIPSIQDSDSDDEQPKPKKSKPSSGAAGFLGSLPAPRGSSGGKESGRAFIPYTLTKHKPQPSKPSAPPKTSNKKTSKHINSVTRLTEEYSDSDEENVSGDAGTSENFFSLASEPERTRTGLVGVVNSTPSLVNNAPSSSHAEEVAEPRITAASLYNMSEEVEEAPYEYMEAEPSSGAEINNLLHDEQFLRLQGKKQRGKETIEFIDVHTDDQTVSELELTKNLSQEVDPSAFAHRKKGEGPSGQQKRKHQITYLAFQAKERELELKNTWAANRATKQQTQAKYGF